MARVRTNQTAAPVAADALQTLVNRIAAGQSCLSFGAGPRTILGIGGWIGSWELWSEPFALLSSTWRTIAYDHRCRGTTVAPVDTITVANMVDDLFAVMDAYDTALMPTVTRPAAVAAQIEAFFRAEQAGA